LSFIEELCFDSYLEKITGAYMWYLTQFKNGAYGLAKQLMYELGLGDDEFSLEDLTGDDYMPENKDEKEREDLKFV
jgi:hypothetical protein